MAKSALALGTIDPAGCTVADLSAVMASAADVLLVRLPASCPLTIALAKAMCSGWSPARHFLHHAAVRDAVHTMLLVAERLRLRRGAQSGTRRSVQQLEHVAASEGPVSIVLPPLPSELLLAVCSFVLRSHFAVP